MQCTALLALHYIIIYQWYSVLRLDSDNLNNKCVTNHSCHTFIVIYIPLSIDKFIHSNIHIPPTFVPTFAGIPTIYLAGVVM